MNPRIPPAMPLELYSPSHDSVYWGICRPRGIGYIINGNCGVKGGVDSSYFSHPPYYEERGNFRGVN